MMNNPVPSSHSAVPQLREQDVALIDVGMIDPLVDQFGAEYTQTLFEFCFSEIDHQIQRLEAAGIGGYWGECLTAIHYLRGIAIECGASALSHDITAAKAALFAQDYSLLGMIIVRMKSTHRGTRSATLVRLAKSLTEMN